MSLVFCVALVAGELGMCLKMEPAYVQTCYDCEPWLLSYSCNYSNPNVLVIGQPVFKSMIYYVITVF